MIVHCNRFLFELDYEKSPFQKDVCCSECHEKYASSRPDGKKIVVSPKEFINKELYMDLDDDEVKLGELEAENLWCLGLLATVLIQIFSVLHGNSTEGCYKAMLESHSRVLQ